MSELVIAIHEAVQPLSQIFYICCMLAASALILSTIIVNKQGE